MKRLLVFGFVCFLSTSLSAKVSDKEAAKLGKSLNPLGGQMAGNADGTIPAWSGGIQKSPKGYTAGGYHIDPYPEDKLKFSITAENVSKYASKLTPGQQALLKRYPETFKMNVYPTRRTASYPQKVYEALALNAKNAELTEDGNGVRSAVLTSPFPIPQNGLEIVWNHLLRYRGRSNLREVIQVSPTAGGSFTPVVIEEKIKYLYAQPGATIQSINNRFGFFLQRIKSPARLAGTILLVHETLDQKSEPRQAWTYNTGQRRVRKAPNVAFDNPGTASDGQRTNDQLDMFNGSPERYNWVIIGKKEIYVPYNNYKLQSPKLSYGDIVQAGHLNPDHLRYELHRVWVVEGQLKSGTSHIYKKRVFYVDEDSWQILVADQYDNRDKIWRVSEAYAMNYYSYPLVWDAAHAHYDLQNGRYLSFGLNNETYELKFDLDLSDAEFTPTALRQAGRR